MNERFWKKKRVLLTGHTGFKGSWLSLWLQKLGAEVIGYALSPPTEPSLFEVADVGAGMTSITGDVRDLSSLKKLFKDQQPEIVIHLAAQSLVRYSYQEPIETYETNVMGTLNVLESIRCIKSVRAALMVTSDKCYDNMGKIESFRENDPMGGHDPYSSSKGCAELLISSYRNSYFALRDSDQPFAAIGSARAGNVIGGGDWATDRLIPDIIRAFKNHKPVHVRNPKAVRPWQHVLEPLSGYLKLVEKLYADGTEYAEAWNFGPSEEDIKPVEWIKSVRAALMVTSDKCYDNMGKIESFRENDPMGGHDPYSSSKGCAELLISSYRNSYFALRDSDQPFAAIGSARAGNVIGGGDWATDRLIPDIIRAFKNHKPVHVRNPKAVRPWQHVLEPLSGYLKLVEKLYADGTEYAEAWNFGPSEEDIKPVEWIVEKMAKGWGNNASWAFEGGDHPYEANLLMLNSSKARAKLSWQPRWGLEEALDRVIEWYKQELASSDLKRVCLKQIHDYTLNQGKSE